MIIPINTHKKLADQSIELIRQKLTSLTYVSEVFPAVKIGQRENGSTYPAVYVQEGQQKILDLTPNTKYKSYIFFEKRNYALANNEGINTFDLSLIFWGNLKAIDDTKKYDFTDELVNEITNILRYLDCGDFSISFENIFGKYNLHESVKQFFMYPFTSFKIDFTCFLPSCK